MFHIPTPIILLFGLTAATCVIAYWSDNLGKKLGKKRISLQLGPINLRPRQTATLITMLSSVGIMLVTLAAMTIFSKQVRDALLRADRLNEKNNLLLAQNTELTHAATQLQKNVESSKELARIAERNAHLATQKADAATQGANRRVAQSRTLIAQAETQLRGTRGQLSAAQNARAQAQIGEANARRGQSAARAQAQQIVARLNQARAFLAGAQGRLDAVNARLVNANRGLARAQMAIVQVKQGTRNVLESNRTLLVQLATNRARVENLNAERSKLEGEVSGARKNLEEVRVAASSVYETAVALGSTAARLGQGRVIIDLGQVFSEIVVPPDASADELRGALHRLLEQGSEAAAKLGGQPYTDESGVSRALHLAPIPATILDPNAQSDAELIEPQILEHFVNFLLNFNEKGSVSVRLTAARRYAEGEAQFAARLVPVPIRRAFTRGETISDATISAGQSDARVFNQLLALIDKGGQAARERGVLPLLSKDDPDFFAADTNEALFKALRAVQARGGKSAVRLVAADDLFTVDHPSVRFQVESG